MSKTFKQFYDKTYLYDFFVSDRAHTREKYPIRAPNLKAALERFFKKYIPSSSYDVKIDSSERVLNAPKTAINIIEWRLNTWLFTITSAYLPTLDEYCCFRYSDDECTFNDSKGATLLPLNVTLDDLFKFDQYRNILVLPQTNKILTNEFHEPDYTYTVPFTQILAFLDKLQKMQNSGLTGTDIASITNI